MTGRFGFLPTNPSLVFSRRPIIRNAVDVLIANRGSVIVSVLAQLAHALVDFELPGMSRPLSTIPHEHT